MKAISMVLLVLLSATSYAQVIGTRPFKTIINEAPYGFLTYKGEFSGDFKSDSAFHSTVVLEGTYNNHIWYFGNGIIQYIAFLHDSVSIKQAEATTEKWKAVIDKVAVGLIRTKLTSKLNEYGTKGYQWKRKGKTEGYTVDLLYYRYPNYPLYRTYISINYPYSIPVR